MRSLIAALFALGTLIGQQKPAETPKPSPVAVKPEPLPELVALKISLIQSEYEKAGLILKASPAYQAYEAKTQELGKSMDALLAQEAKNCRKVDQATKTFVPIDGCKAGK